MGDSCSGRLQGWREADLGSRMRGGLAERLQADFEGRVVPLWGKGCACPTPLRHVSHPPPYPTHSPHHAILSSARIISQMLFCDFLHLRITVSFFLTTKKERPMVGHKTGARACDSGVGEGVERSTWPVVYVRRQASVAKRSTLAWRKSTTRTRSSLRSGRGLREIFAWDIYVL